MESNITVPCGGGDEAGSVLSDTESVSSVASSRAGRRRRPPKERNRKPLKQTDKNLFGPNLTVREFNLLRRDERSLPVALRARKELLDILLLQDDLGDEMMTCLFDILLAASKIGGEDVEDVFRFLTSRQFISIHLFLFVLKCRVNIAFCRAGNVLLKVVFILMAFCKLGCQSNIGIQMVAALTNDTILHNLDDPERMKCANVLQDVMIILTNGGPDTSATKEDIRNIPIFPTAGEVVDLVPAEVCDSVLEGRPSMTKFLACHFRLLREDIVQPLRNPISEYHQVKRQMGLGEAKRRCHIIDGVKLHEIITTHTSKGVTFRVQFDTASLENVSWETTRILSFGNMVCLTNNHFHDMIFATVAKRDPQWLKQGFVDLRLFRLEDTKLLKAGLQFFMIDTRKYVEESYEVLASMQQLDPTLLPFAHHIVYQTGENEHCADIKKDPSIQFDVGPLMKEDQTSRRYRPRTWRTPLLSLEKWPPIDQLCVDEHQLAAIQAALTNQLTVITGAPGTGKSHVSLKLTQLFVLNRHQSTRDVDCSFDDIDGSPLLFLCATKETLDDYLTGVSFFHRDGIVRWAGQHTRRALQEYQIENLREQNTGSTAYQEQAFREKLEHCKRRLADVNANISNLRTKIFPEEILKLVMGKEHYKSLKVQKETNSPAVMLEWLLTNYVPEEDIRKLREDIPFNLSRFVIQIEEGDAWLERSVPFIVDSLSNNISKDTGKLVNKQLTSKEKMNESESRKIKDLWTLSLQDRWRIYRLWTAKLEARIQERCMAIFQEMEQINLDCQKAHDEIDESILRAASVIGMTASSVAKNRRVIQRINPRTIIVEEGADILQSLTLSVIPTGCQQLILIGENISKVDQYQAVKQTAEKRDILASLLQQLVERKYSVFQLKTQHRMSPTVSKLCRNLFRYDFQNDQSVIELPGIRGLQHEVFFVDYKDHTSPANHEASFVLALCNHLLGMGFARRQISIIVSFSAQQNLFGTSMKDRVFTIDSFRSGSDIVLFMCNGSERASRPGCFLREQRITTVLTRARRGLYLIGNFSYLSSQSDTWARIVQEARRLEWLGNSLKLTCPHHPSNPVPVSSADGFQLYEERRGCGLPCEDRLECGHQCKALCHDHEAEKGNIICRQPCNKVICKNGHKCSRTCSETCPTKCNEKVDKQLSCGHYQRLPCNLSPSHATCRDKCERLLSCGHKCTGICGDPCNKETCVEMTTKSDWPCKHVVKVRCCDGPESCPEPCNAVLACGHLCTGTCGKCRRGRLHVVCQQPCGRTLVCGHSCESNCAAQCPPCTKRCQNRCQHSVCRKFCGEACVPCREPCLWRCPHISCPRLCGEPCDRKPCNESCGKNLPCGHPCIGLCGEQCPTKCRVCDKEEVTAILFGSEDEEDARFVQLEDCGHVIEVEALDQYMNMAQVGDDDVTIQIKGCPKCKTPIRRNLRYGNIIKQTLKDVENVKAKMRGDEASINAKMHELQTRASKLRARSGIHERDQRKLLEGLTRMTHLEKILARLNRCAFCEVIADVRAKLPTNASSTFELKTRKNALEGRLRELRKVVLDGDLDKFYDQQMHDLQREISRVSLQAKAMTSLTRNMTTITQNIKSSHLKAFDDVVEKDGAFTSRDEALAKRRLQEFSKSMGHAVLGITDRERVQIIKAIGLSQGHWYKCPKGHVYAIGECGGAMEESKCPECGASIGGGSHRLTTGNRVASEMDGATRAAWPTGDIGYDDYQEEEGDQLFYEEEEQDQPYFEDEEEREQPYFENAFGFDPEEIEEQFQIERLIRQDQEREDRFRMEREREAAYARQNAERIAAMERARLERERRDREERRERERREIEREINREHIRRQQVFEEAYRQREEKRDKNCTMS